MEFGVVLQTDPPAWRVVELTKRAEALGFEERVYPGQCKRSISSEVAPKP